MNTGVAEWVLGICLGLVLALLVGAVGTRAHCEITGNKAQCPTLEAWK